MIQFKILFNSKNITQFKKNSIMLYPRFNSKYYSIQNIIQFKKNSIDSIQKIIQFNSQGLIDTGRKGKVPKNCPKSVQNRQKGVFNKKW